MWYFSADRSINPCSVSSPSMNIEHTHIFRTHAHTMLNSLKIDKEIYSKKNTRNERALDAIDHIHRFSRRWSTLLFVPWAQEPKWSPSHTYRSRRARAHAHAYRTPHMLVLLSTSQSTNQMRLLNQILIDNCSYNLTSFG